MAEMVAMSAATSTVVFTPSSALLASVRSVASLLNLAFVADGIFDISVSKSDCSSFVADDLKSSTLVTANPATLAISTDSGLANINLTMSSPLAAPPPKIVPPFSVRISTPRARVPV